MKKAKHLAEEYGEKAVNKVKSVRDEGKIFEFRKVIKMKLLNSKVSLS